jgi:hypothetical protein
MKTFRICLILLGLCALFIGTAPMIRRAFADNVSAATNKQLAQARIATAKYHDVANAIADGYVPIGCEDVGPTYVNFGLVDCTFDIDHPEVLHYITKGDQLQLVGVEYAIPFVCTPDTAPAGFAGDADVWLHGEGEGGPPVWALNVWLWQGNPNGIFAHDNPNLPECPAAASLRAPARSSDRFVAALEARK